MTNSKELLQLQTLLLLLGEYEHPSQVSFKFIFVLFIGEGSECEKILEAARLTSEPQRRIR